MKQVFVSDFDSKTFEDAKECLEYDFEKRGGKQFYSDFVYSFFRKLSEKYQLEFRNIVIDSKVENDYDDNRGTSTAVINHNLSFETWKDGTMLGDVGYHLNGEKLEIGFIEEYVKSEYITPLLKEWEGVVSMADFNYGLDFLVGDVDANDLFMKLQGKKIRIEVIED